MKSILCLMLAAVAWSMPAAPVVNSGAGVVVTRDHGDVLQDGIGTIDFGTLDINGTKTLKFTATNESLEPITQLAWTLAGPDAIDFALDAPPISELAPGASASFSVTYVPSESGKTSHASVTLLGGGVNQSAFDIALTGKGGAAQVAIQVQDSNGGVVSSGNNGVPFDFGSPVFGNASVKTFHITNKGTAALTNMRVAVQEPLYLYDWRGAYVGSSGYVVSMTLKNARLEPGASVEVQLQWWPYSEAVISRDVIVTADNLANPPFVIPVTGKGTIFTPSQQRLGGLHYRLGDGLAAGDLVLYPQYGVADMSSSEMTRWLFQPDAAEGSTVDSAAALLDPAQVGTVSANMLYTSSSFFRIFQPFEPVVSAPELQPSVAPLNPRVAPAVGPGSAAAVMGGSTGIAFQGGSGLRQHLLKLPAQDNVGMEFWFKPESVSGIQCLVLMGEPDSGFGLYLNDVAVQARVGSARISSSILVAAGDWHHVALILHGGVATVHLDGVNVGSVADCALATLVRGLSIGSTMTGDDAFHGTVDQLRLFEVPETQHAPETHLLATAKPVSSVSRTGLNFPSTIAGTQIQQSFWLENAGPGWLAIEKVEIVGASASDFSVKGSFAEPLNTPEDLNYLTNFGSLGDNVLKLLEPRKRLRLTVSFIPSQADGRLSREATLRFTTNDPANPVHEVLLTGNAEPARPEIEVSPRSYSWGQVLTNQYRQFSIEIRNKGSHTLTGIKATPFGVHAEDITIPVLEDSILANSSLLLTVTVVPKGGGARYAGIRIESNDADEGIVDVLLTGRGVVAVPEIAVTGQVTRPSTPQVPLTDGGSFAVGSALSGGGSTDLLFSINSAGTADLENVSITIDGPHAADFTRVQGWTYDFERLYGLATFGLRFTPGGVGIRTAVLRITSNDADESPFDITLTGEGLKPAPIFEAADQGKLIPSGTGFLRLGTAVIDGISTTKSFMFRNAGTAPMTGLRASFTGKNSQEFSAAVPVSIAPGTEGEIVVSFAPRGVGPRSATLELSSNAFTGSPYRMAVGGTGAYGSVASLTAPEVAGWTGTAFAELPNGNVLMTGYVLSNGVKNSRIRELRPDGTETSRFSLIVLEGEIRALAVQADGAVVVTGSGMGVKRLHPEGSAPDSSFGPPAGEFTGNAIVVLSNGKIMVGGVGSLGGRARLIRLNANGSLDPTFALPEPDAVVHALALQEDGKVLVGGEFTNLGRDNWAPPIVPEDDEVFENISLGGVSPRSGLCRLNEDGSDDPTFANRGFHKVTSISVRGDRIAVGGVDQRYNYIIAYGDVFNPNGLGAVSMPITFIPYSQPVARLLRRSGAIIATRDLTDEPTAVSMLPGDHFLVAQGNAAAFPVTSRPAVVLVKPARAGTEWYGLKLEIELPPGATYQALPFRHQAFEGTVRALHAQADGKVLVAGDLTKSVTVQTYGWIDDFSTGNLYSIPRFTEPNAPLTQSGVPLAGFAQLDVDGFLAPAPKVWRMSESSTRAISDGLTKLVVGPLGGTSLTVPDPALGGAIWIDGVDANAFTWSRIPLMRLAYIGAPDFIQIQFSPGHAGPHRAVLHIRQSGFANELEIALEAQGEGNLPPEVLVLDGRSGAEFKGNELWDFGAVATGESESLALLILNTSSDAYPRTIRLSIGGPNASEYSVSHAELKGLKADSSFRVFVTFKPGSAGQRDAILHLTAEGEGGYPLSIRLGGQGVAPPVLVQHPQDTLVQAGQPLMLSAESLANVPLTWQWFKDGRRLAGQNSNTLLIPDASLANAGTYTARALSAGVSLTSRPARVGVVESQAQTITAMEGKAVTLVCKTAGPGLTYQWSLDGGPLPKTQELSGVNAAKLVVKPINSFSAGGTYTCTVRLGTSILESAPIQMTVLLRPRITDFPAVETWMVGSPVEGAFTATPAPLRYHVQGLPPGVIVNTVTGAVSGRPLRAGAYVIRVSASNAAGMGPTATFSFSVNPLPAGFVGAFHGWIERSAYNGWLGGTWSINVTSAGTYTARIRMASPTVIPASAKKQKAGSLAASVRGGLVDRLFTGRLDALYREPTPEWIWTASSEATSAVGDVINFGFNSGTRTAQFVFTSANGEFAAGEASKAATKLMFRQMAGSYRGHYLEFFGGGNWGPVEGNVTATVYTSASMAWTAKLSDSQNAPVLTGSSPLNADGYLAYVFALVPDPAGGRSLEGSLFFEPGEVGTMSGGFFWGNGSPFDPGTPEGTEGHNYMVDGLKVK